MSQTSAVAQPVAQPTTTAANHKPTLIRELGEGVSYAYFRARVWGFLYYTEKSLLILFSVLTSADALKALATLQASVPGLGAIPAAASIQPAFGLMVLLLTAYDVWLKPETKYKGYYQAHEEYHELQTYVEMFVDENDQVALGKSYDGYKQINQRLRAIL